MTFDRAVNQETGASGRRYRNTPLPVDVVKFGADVYTQRKQVGVKQLYGQVPQTAWVSWSSRQSSSCNCSWSQLGDKMPSWESACRLRTCATQDPRLSSPAEWGRIAAIVRGTRGQYVAVCSVSNSPITHNQH